LGGFIGQGAKEEVEKDVAKIVETFGRGTKAQQTKTSQKATLEELQK